MPFYWFAIGSVLLVLGLTPPVGQTICRLPKKVKEKKLEQALPNRWNRTGIETIT